MNRVERLRKNFPIDYVKQMGVKELCLVFKAGDYPPEWDDLENVKKALIEFDEDPNASFFKRKLKS